MAQKSRTSWLISPKSFIQLIGAEYEILKRSGSDSLIKFYISAVLIIIILLVSSVSIYYAMELLFHDYKVEIALAAFISLLFVFIYIFLINTFSKGLFHNDTSKEIGIGYMGIKISDVIRTGFVIFIGFLISKPLETYVFRKKLNAETEVYKESLINSYSKRLDTLNMKDRLYLLNKKTFYEKQIALFPSSVLQAELDKVKGELTSIDQQKNANIEVAKKKIKKYDFLLFRIKRVCRYPLAWVMCIGIVFIFLIPGFLIYSISSGDEYFKMKKESESKMINEEYRDFKFWYESIFREQYQLKREYYSHFEDPPFNTKRKKGPKIQPQDDFLKKYS